MDTFNNGQAYEVIKAALQADAIKLIGSHSAKDQAVKNGESDAAYLLTLLSRLQKGQGS